MVRFVDDEPMRTAVAPAELQQVRQQRREVARPVGNGDAGHADDAVDAVVLEELHHLFAARLGVGLADDDGSGLFFVVAFRIDDAQLIGTFEQRFDDAARDRRLAARGGAADENAPVIRFERHRHACARRHRT